MGKPTLKIPGLILCFAAFLLTVQGADAAVYRISGGQLIGAENVLVNGSYYDVTFLEGTAENIWNLSGGGTFDFTAQADAEAAAIALGAQVFNNQVMRNYGTASWLARDDYDIFPQLTYGIESFSIGVIVVPYMQQSDAPIFFRAEAFYNDTGDESLNVTDPDYIGGFNTTVTHDLSLLPNAVFARFQPVALPVPGSGFLLGCGLASLAVCGRRKGNCRRSTR